MLAPIAAWADERALDFRHDRETGMGAVFSRCGTWRYLLWRTGGARGRMPRRVLGMGMLNPSRADETRDDPTIARCRARAVQARCSGLIVWNLFAFCATLPADLKRASDPVGPDNDGAIGLALALSSRTVLAWGNHGAERQRDEAVLALCGGRDLAVLGLTGTGRPRHPLYLPRQARLRRWGLPS